MPSCRTSAAATTNSPPTSHRRSGWRQHSANWHWPCDRLFFQTRRLPGQSECNRPPDGVPVVLSDLGRYEVGHGSSTIGAHKPPNDCSQPDDHYNQRTSHRPGFGHRAPFEHRAVHSGHSNDLVSCERAGQGLAMSAPPGTRTPNPRIKSPNLVLSSWFGSCRLVPFPQASDEPLCRPMSAQAGYLPGHRAPMEHHDWHLVLDRQTGWGERWNGRSSGLQVRCCSSHAGRETEVAVTVGKQPSAGPGGNGGVAAGWFAQGSCRSAAGRSVVVIGRRRGGG
jgi:hypothetical protein